MSAKWEKKGTNDGVLTFEINQEDVAKGLTATFNRIKGNLNVPGFRKGKVSRAVFNKMYGEASLYEDTLNNLLPVAYEAAVKEAGIDPVAQPKINVESMEKDAAWVISADVFVKPEVKLGEYKDLTVEKQDREVTDQDVEDRLKQKQEQEAELVLKEDQPAENGDTVVIDFEGFKGDEAFEGGKAENHSLELGSGSFIPGFEEQLVGVKAGEELEVNVTFPEDYQAADLAGQAVVFKVTVHEVKAKELPALDDEFAKDIDSEVDGLDALKAKYKEEMQQQKVEAADEAVKDAAIKQAVANAEIKDLPEVMIHDEVHRAMDEFLGNLQRQGISEELYYQLTGSNKEALHVQFEGEAEERVRTNLVVEAIADAEKFDATAKEIEEEVQTLADQYNMDIKAVRNALTDDMLKHDIRLRKAIDVITDTAKEA